MLRPLRNRTESTAAPARLTSRTRFRPSAAVLFGVSPADAVTMIGVVALVILVAAVACLRPALRASRLDPNVVLRVG